MAAATVALEIDGRPVEVAEGSTVLDAASCLSIAIPTMCHRSGYENPTSCMVCLVEDTGSGRLLPACSTRAQAGMAIATASNEVLAARRAALELLLSEHVGECEAPCQLACPAHLDVPRMLHHVERGRFAEALEVVWERIPMPAVLARICPAPCERACRRQHVDEAVAICALKGVAAAEGTAWMPVPERAPATGRRVAVVGAGPAGLSAAFYLLRRGHACTVFDAAAAPGGGLRNGPDEEVLPRLVLDAEVEIIRHLGAELRLGLRLGEDLPWETLRASYSAIVLAVGSECLESIEGLGLARTDRGLRVDPGTMQTSEAGIFAAGGAVRQGRMAVRSMAQGRVAAVAVDQLLRAVEVTGPQPRFRSRLRRAVSAAQEKNERRGQAGAGGLAESGRKELSVLGAAQEASRCLRCACVAVDTCKLRELATRYEADQRRYASSETREVAEPVRRGRVVHDPGKCIRCGLCVRITAHHGEALGLAYIGRGFDLRIGVPLDEPLDRGLAKTASLCAEACPTGALAVDEEELEGEASS